MLSRNAQDLYWMGRYLERASQLCHLLRLQVETLVDRPTREIHFGWDRIYTSLGRVPPGGAGLEHHGSEDYFLADSYTLAGDLTFERTNPDSVRSCFALGRENARQTRHCISPEMWTCLNLAWLRICDLDIEHIWKVSPESFYAETARGIDTFIGVSEATMYRSAGWHFMRMGHFIERAQRLVALLCAQLSERIDADWTSLLCACQAFDAYKACAGVDVQSDRALDLLVTDPLLSGSLRRSLDAMAAELAAVGPGPDPDASSVLERLAGRLCALIHFEWPDREDQRALLAEVGAHCREFHQLAIAAYVDYDVR